MSIASRRMQQGAGRTLVETSVTVSNVTDNSATLHWTTVPGATGYLVGRDGNDSQGHGPWSQVDAADTLAQTFTSLLPNTTYTLYCQPQPNGIKQSIQITTQPAPVGGLLPDPDVGTAVGSANYAVPAGAIFVATNGSDSADGTKSSPYKTLTHAIGAATNGDTIVVRGGVYYGEGNDTQNGSGGHGIDIYNSITIQNYPGEAVWFDGSKAANSWTSSGGLWTAPYDRLFDRSPTNSRGADDGSGAWGWVTPEHPCAAWPDMVFMDGVQLEQVENKTDLGPGKFWVEGDYTHADPNNDYWFQATAVWIADDPAGHDMRVSDRVRFLFTHQPSTNIKGIGMRRYSNSNPDGGIITVLFHDSLMENLWIEDVANDGIHLAGDTGRDAGSCIVRKCTFRRTGNLAVTGYESDGSIFDRVDVQYANFSRFNYAPQAGGIKVSRCQTIVVKNSLFSHIWGKGFWTDMSVDNAQVYNTVFNDTDDKAIKFECGTNRVTLANCLFNDINSFGFQVNNCDRADVWNCTIVDAADYGAHWPQDNRRPSNTPYNKDPRQPDSYYQQSYNQWQINQLGLHNTVITSSSSPLFALKIGDRGLPDSRSLADFDLSIDGNLYNCRSSVPSNAYLLPNSSNGSTTYANLPAFRSASGQDGNSTLVAGQAVLDSSHKVLDSTYHSNATALPSNIAAAIGQAAGTKHVGAFL